MLACLSGAKPRTSVDYPFWVNFGLRSAQRRCPFFAPETDIESAGSNAMKYRRRLFKSGNSSQGQANGRNPVFKAQPA